MLHSIHWRKIDDNIATQEINWEVSVSGPFKDSRGRLEVQGVSVQEGDGEAGGDQVQERGGCFT